MTWIEPSFAVNGARKAGVVFDLRSVTGPNPYTADGIAVDLTSVFSTVYHVGPPLARVTATGAATGRVYEVNQPSGFTFADRKFKIKVSNPTSSNGGTTSTDFLTATGAAANVAATETGAAAVCGSLSCTGTHPNTIVAQRANLVQASGAAKTSAVTALSSQVAQEVGAIDLSGITIEYLVMGVPA